MIMKNSLKFVLFCTTGLVVLQSARAGSLASMKECQAIYDSWHNALDSNPILVEPMFFDTEGVPQDLVTAVTAIKSNRLAMAYFLCEKIAETQYPISSGRAYQDAWLLDEVAGIDLMRADDKPIIDQDFGQNIAKFFARFREEWRQGVYKDPSQKIGQLCQQLLSKEGKENIAPQDLTAIRRYGIFGLPELIRQSKKHNSKHAFAAYLIITGQRDRYAEYIRIPNRKFTTREEKLQHIDGKVKEMKASGDAELDVMKKISVALSEQ